MSLSIQRSSFTTKQTNESCQEEKPSWIQYAQNLIRRTFTKPQITFSSPLFQVMSLRSVAVASGLFALKNLVRMQLGMPLALTVVCIATAQYIVKKNGVTYRSEYALNRNLIYNHQGKFPWISEIIPGKLYLGGIPLTNFGHNEQLKKRKVTRYTSVVESKEFVEQWLTEPLKHDKAKGEMTQVEASDYEPVPVDKLREGVEDLEKQLSAGEVVYVHCKSGKGRSPAVVLAWMLEHGHKYIEEVSGLRKQYMKVDFDKYLDEVFQILKKKRPVISMGKPELLPVKEYIKSKIKNQIG